ncbi:MAG: 16S rRNA (adenine(1518)-N(6)/adenine(1519)-N(6))-dimethyltransferase RsmA [Caulobacteraceae bacterium]|nr:16S rRNA (adenine(1518)-N(6)/adenine(1519)-N(6))-dimethyltransferase RsmA [Caulobacteraceae bacterium]
MTPPDLAALPPLREALAAEGLRADKRFGQHFLFDLNLCRKIARQAGDLDGAAVVEVGPGPGGLTRALLEAGARVLAIEADARFIPILETLAAAAPRRLSVVQADALAADETSLLREADLPREALVVSNLPYNVGTPLFVKWLTGAWRPTGMVLMFQKEVAQRIVAAPGSAAYGRLSVLSQALCAVDLALEAPARAFTPPPKVDSAVIRASPLRNRPDARRLAALETVTAAAFGQRRKMLRSSLRALGGESLCVEAGLAPDARAETIDIPGFLRLADVWLMRG